jgi:thiol-disulfide isomerase/thioredoxin
MHTKNLLIALLALLAACKTQSQQPPPRIPITITGHIKGISAKTDTLFIVEAHQWEKPLHFTKVVNDSFTFNISARAGYLPVALASIGYYGRNRKIELIDFSNDTRSNDTMQFAMNSFVMEPPLVTISSDPVNEKYCIVRTKVENQAYYRTQMTDFGFLPSQTHDNDPKLLLYKSIIKEYPASYYLLHLIDGNKARYSNNQLEGLLGLFTDSLRQSLFGQSIQQYVARRKEMAPETPSLALLTDKGGQAPLFSPAAKLNVIVLWASWCAPCRREIPGFKQLYGQWKQQGLHIASVAIDDNTTAWKAAVRQEQMPWPQLFADSLQSLQLKKLYETEVLPTVVFTDADGKVLRVFVGYENNSMDTYSELVATLLGNGGQGDAAMGK